ncbi:MAG: recombination mediator RecR [Ferrimicrobium sp.]
MYPNSMQLLIDELGRLPGIGPKSAQRIALALIKRGPQDAVRLADAISKAVVETRSCSRCFALSEEELCLICSNLSRDGSIICVVEEPRDVLSFERSRTFRGLYHVLGGVISPIEGIGPDQLHLRELLERLRDPAIREVVVATSATVEGEATALYLARMLAPSGISVSRLATGVPVGGDLDYVDEITLARALEGRRHMDGGAPSL